jgi:DNA-binding IclR family transcriptional regulator
MKTINKTVQILDALVNTDGARVTELSRQLDIPESTVHSHLKSLSQHGFVQNKGGIYVLGLKFLYYGGDVLHNSPEYEQIQEKVATLAEKTRERSQFITEQDGQGIYLHVETKSDGAVRTDVRMGKIVNLHTTAAGKAILANLPDHTVESIIERYGLDAQTENTITDKEALFAELKEIREQSYSINDEERITKQRAVGAPVLDASGRVVGAFSVSGPTHRMSGDRFKKEIPNLLLGTANEVELNIKYR